MYISIDLGGTNTRIASSTDLKEIYSFDTFPTQDTVEKEKVLIEKGIEKVAEGNPVEKMCFGVPGIIDKKERVFKIMPNWPTLDNKPFDSLSENSENIIFENDAILAGLGEAVFGAGKNYTSVAYITLSTGVGGVKITNKKIDENQQVWEPGHMIINFDGQDFDYGLKGTVESYISGPSFEKIYGISPKECKDQETWNKYAYHLAACLHNVTVMWNPEIIVIGGGLSNKFDYFEQPLIKQLQNQTLVEVPNIDKASLKDKAGLFGGFAIISDNI